MKLLVEWLEDIMAAVGLLLTFAGAWVQFGIGYALLAAGGILLALGVIMAMRK
jgi:hypothetical protein